MGRDQDVDGIVDSAIRRAVEETFGEPSDLLEALRVSVGPEDGGAAQLEGFGVDPDGREEDPAKSA